MKIGFGVAFGALLMAGACASPDAPQSRGVGFDDYSAYELDRARREAQLTGSQSIIPAPRINTVASPTPMQQAIPSADLARAGIGQMQPAVTPFVPAPPAVSQPVAAPSNNTGISDEQSFDAVAGRETIQSDAERRAGKRSPGPGYGQERKTGQHAIQRRHAGRDRSMADTRGAALIGVGPMRLPDALAAQEALQERQRRIGERKGRQD